LLARLAVFAGGCTLESAEAVCDPQGDLGVDVMDGVSSLLDKSLVFAEESADGTRVSMLQTIHEYAAERLQASGEADSMAARHAEHYLELAEQAEPELWGAEQSLWFRRLDLEHDNVRAALAWALAEPDPEIAVRLAASMGAYWEGRGQVAEAYRWFDGALACGPASGSSRGRGLLAKSRFTLIIEDDPELTKPLLEEARELLQAAGDTRRLVVALSHLGVTLRALGDEERADSMFAESVRVARRHGDDWALALALNNEGSDLMDRGLDPARARSLCEEALSLRRALGEPRGIAVTLATLGGLALSQGDADEAMQRYEESLSMVEEAGLVPQIAAALGGMALAAVQQGDGRRARDLLPEAVRVAHQLRDPYATAQAVTVAAGVALHGGDRVRAVRLCGAASRFHEAMGWTPVETRTVAEAVLAAARARAGDEQVEEAFAAGRALGTEDAVAEALAVADLSDKDPQQPVT
jgi:tetratricopeptide (TPR) repeat protein